jgi:hypothetical protein
VAVVTVVLLVLVPVLLVPVLLALLVLVRVLLVLLGLVRVVLVLLVRALEVVVLLLVLVATPLRSRSWTAQRLKTIGHANSSPKTRCFSALCLSVASSSIVSTTSS